jgi:hypothetical protein
MSRSRMKLLAGLNLTGFLATVIFNTLAITLPINNKSTGQLADQYPNLFVPAGLTFSIWGLIYLLLAVFVIFQVIITIRRDEAELAAFGKIGYYFFFSCALNIGWLFAWHYEMVPLSLVIMLLLLGCLVTIYLRLYIGRDGSSNRIKYLVHLPFSIYLGWITIATIANVTALRVDIGWDRFGLSEQFWTIAVIIMGIVVAFLVMFTRQDIYYCLVVDWAFAGILIKRLADASPAQGVIIVTIAGLLLITIGIIAQIARKRIYAVGKA